jgi:hypothetical protein
MIKTLVKKSAAFVLSCALVFVILEGLCSSLVVVQALLTRRSHVASPSRASHTQYDPELGWVNIPNFFKRDYYNPGVYIKTNSRGFRNEGEFDVQIPANKLRVICSGDSFAFGTGVDNEHTWCQQLASLDHRLQTVNMGEPGYGVDQAYLWYTREGARLDHDVHILAVIADDFVRMQQDTQVGYGKPVVKLQGDRLIATNVPVPTTRSFLPRLTYADLLFEFRSFQVLRGILHKVRLTAPSNLSMPTDAERQVARRIITVLQAINKQKNSVLVLVYFPTREEVTASEDQHGTWQDFLPEEAGKRGIAFISFLKEIRKLPISEVDRLFIPEGYQYFSMAAGHFTDYGNEYVAGKLYQFLAKNPEVSAKLARLR